MHIGPSPPPQLVREGLKPVLQAPHADEPDEQLSLLASLQTFFAAASQISMQHVAAASGGGWNSVLKSRDI